MPGALSVLAVVPARGGSKRVPGKNLREVGGKPLLAWTLEQARRARSVGHLAVSSEDGVILAAAARLGCDTALRRPDELARDETPGVDPVLHAIDAIPGYDLVVLLQPTSPLRSPEDIDACVALCSAPGAVACVSLAPIPAGGPKDPSWAYRLDERGCIIAARAQEPGACYVLNGAVYAARTTWLRQHRSFLSPQTLGYRMPADRSLDIDTPQDLELAERLLAARRP
jgi:CMP-N,N'-diacetyllegionaminic acid synthase